MKLEIVGLAISRRRWWSTKKNRQMMKCNITNNTGITSPDLIRRRQSKLQDQMHPNGLNKQRFSKTMTKNNSTWMSTIRNTQRRNWIWIGENLLINPLTIMEYLNSIKNHFTLSLQRWKMFSSPNLITMSITLTMKIKESLSKTFKMNTMMKEEK